MKFIMTKRDDKSRWMQWTWMGLLMGAAVILSLLALTKVNAQTLDECSLPPESFLVDTTKVVSNDPDSGGYGNWATDNFTRHIKIWQENEYYCATATDEGTFVTTGPNSPESGNPLDAAITGSMMGGVKLFIEGEFNGQAGDVPDLDCNFQDCSATSQWVQHYFSQSAVDYLDWGWTYTSCGHDSWTNADSGNTGDIVTGPTDEVCTKPEEPTPTPGQPGNPPTFAGSSTEAPVCTTGNTLQLPANLHVTRNGSEATVNFFITQGDSANIYYRVVGQNNWQYSVINVKPNSDNFVSYTVHDLDPVLGYEFGIQQKFGCGSGEMVTAIVVDGPTPTIFPFSYWEWSR